jgi:hypothetical protein
MSHPGFSKSVVESAALAQLETFDYRVEHGSNIAIGELAHAHCVEPAL